jgi:hypothetical protein
MNSFWDHPVDAEVPAQTLKKPDGGVVSDEIADVLHGGGDVVIPVLVPPTFREGKLGTTVLARACIPAQPVGEG